MNDTEEEIQSMTPSDNAQEAITRVKQKMEMFAVPMQKYEFSRETYQKLFPDGKIQTPAGAVKLGEHQYEKLKARGREEYLGAVYQTLSDPGVIIEIEEKGGRVKLYTKSFRGDQDSKMDAVISVVVDIGGVSVSISTHRRNVNNTLNKIKKGGILYEKDTA
jgi:hypothetical protein